MAGLLFSSKFWFWANEVQLPFFYQKWGKMLKWVYKKDQSYIFSNYYAEKEKKTSIPSQWREVEDSLAQEAVLETVEDRTNRFLLLSR